MTVTSRHLGSLLLTAAVLVLGCDSPAPELDHDHEASDHEVSEAGGRIDADRAAQIELELADAGPGEIRLTTELPGEVRINGDRMAHVTPRVGGIAVEVFKSLGDTVAEGELLARLESRELADIKAQFLAATARLDLAQAAFTREQKLFEQRVSAEQDFLAAQNARTEARVALRSAQQKLLALGFSRHELAELPGHHESDFIMFPLTAPVSGVIIDRHLTRGESVAADAAVFTVADLATVWVDLKVYQKDIGAVRAGQEVLLKTDHGDEKLTSIGFVQPLVGEDTRTALARTEVDNRDGHWHPGCFVTGTVTIATVAAAVAVPPSSLVQMEDGDTVVFVADGDGYIPREVSVGRQDRELVELTAGLETGERYVANGAFFLKAEMLKGSFGHAHAH